MYISQLVSLPPLFESNRAGSRPTLHYFPRDQTSVESIYPGFTGTDTDTQSLFDPNAQDSTILGITFFVVVPIAASIAFLVVKVYNWREQRKHRRMTTKYQRPKKQTRTQPELGFYGKPELGTETARYEVSGEDLRYEIDGNEVGYEMDVRAVGNTVRGRDVIQELHTEYHTAEALTLGVRQELRGSDLSKELEVPGSRLIAEVSKAAT